MMNLAFFSWGVTSLAAAGFCLVRLPRAAITRDLHLLLVGGIVALLGAGWALGERAAQTEQLSLRKMVEGVAPTYAAELARQGHGRLPLDARPDDPLYLELIELEKRWLPWA